MRVIELTQGKVAQVDDEDYLALSAHNWFAVQDKKGVWYAKRNVPLAGGKQTTIRMHVQITGKTGCDHEDGDGLNNQRYNLRNASVSQNAMNRRKPQRSKPSTSQYKGVCKKGSKWIAQIAIDKRPKHGGCYETEFEAAQRYDELAVQHYGEFAKLNFPKETLCKTA